MAWVCVLIFALNVDVPKHLDKECTVRLVLIVRSHLFIYSIFNIAQKELYII